jgi:hypothetical protein
MAGISASSIVQAENVIIQTIKDDDNSNLNVFFMIYCLCNVISGIDI